MLSTRGTRAVVLGASRDANAKVTMLLTPHGAPRPVLAVKTATTERAGQVVLAEAALLRALAAAPLGVIRAQIPTVCAVSQWRGQPAMVCTALPGVPLTVAYHRWRHTARRVSVTRDLTAVLDWCGRLQAVSSGPVSTVTWGVELLPRMAARHAGSPRLESALMVLAPAAERLACVSTPRTVVHGDLWAGNVLLEDGRVTGVVDWEAGSLLGEPLRDLARAVLSYALYLDRHTGVGRRVAGHPGLRADRWGAGVRYLLSGRGWFPDLGRALLRQGLERLGVDPGRWRDVALIGLAEVAATADHLGFATEHLELLAHIDREGGPQ